MQLGHDGAVHGDEVAGQGVLHRAPALGRGQVRELEAADAVADGPDGRVGGAQVLVDHHDARGR